MINVNGFKVKITKYPERDYMSLSLKNKTNVINKLVAGYLNGTVQNLPPLKGYKLLKRIKSGNYRIVIFTKTKTDHEILMIADRKDVYKRVRRIGGEFR